jgi:formate dehydrogenase assembly factor FdhD
MLSKAVPDEPDTLLPEGAASNDLAGDSSVSRLCGTTHIQGRHRPESASRCNVAAPHARALFLNLDQAQDLRDDTGTVHRGLMAASRDVVLS